MSNIDNENIEFQAFLEELRKAYDKVEIELFKRCAETRRGKFIYIYIQSEISKNFEKMVLKGFLTRDEAEQFYKENMSLITKIEMKYSYLYRNDKMEHSMLSADREDVYGACMIGLSKAVNTYKKDRTAKFSSYAYTCMENECRSLAKKLACERKNNNTTVYSGDLSYSNYVDFESKDDDTILEQIEDDNAVEQFKKAEVLSILHDAINTLPERKQGIIKDYFGLNEDAANMTQLEVARKYGISQPRIKTLIEESIEELKKYFHKKGIYEFSSLLGL